VVLCRHCVRNGVAHSSEECSGTCRCTTIISSARHSSHSTVVAQLQCCATNKQRCATVLRCGPVELVQNIVNLGCLVSYSWPVDFVIQLALPLVVSLLHFGPYLVQCASTACAAAHASAAQAHAVRIGPKPIGRVDNSVLSVYCRTHSLWETRLGAVGCRRLGVRYNRSTAHRRYFGRCATAQSHPL
jgi:hypothetical protein